MKLSDSHASIELSKMPLSEGLLVITQCRINDRIANISLIISRDDKERLKEFLHDSP
jgi:hypothetical protein